MFKEEKKKIPLVVLNGFISFLHFFFVDYSIERKKFPSVYGKLYKKNPFALLHEYTIKGTKKK
jgi:hypothetical protein